MAVGRVAIQRFGCPALATALLALSPSLFKTQHSHFTHSLARSSRSRLPITTRPESHPFVRDPRGVFMLTWVPSLARYSHFHSRFLVHVQVTPGPPRPLRAISRSLLSSETSQASPFRLMKGSRGVRGILHSQRPSRTGHRYWLSYTLPKPAIDVRYGRGFSAFTISSLSVPRTLRFRHWWCRSA